MRNSAFSYVHFFNDAIRVTSIYVHDVKIRFVNINHPSVPKKPLAVFLVYMGCFN